MAAKLTTSGISFSDSTVLDSKRGIIPQSTSWVFFQAAAPTGWTKQTTHNNKALRVVSGTGGGSGGSTAFTTVLSPTFAYAGTLATSDATGNTALAESQIAAHAHPDHGVVYNAVPAIFNPDGSFNSWNGGDVVRAGGWTRVSPGTGNAGSTNNHNHPVSQSVPISTTFTTGVQYIDVIVCSFDG